MYTKILFLVLLLTFNTDLSFSSEYQKLENIECKMPKGEVLKIGCTKNCGRFNRWAIRSTARRLGYKVRTIDLKRHKEKVNYTQVDGVLIPGGEDINPDRYINDVTPEMRDYLRKYEHMAELTESGKVRDEFEFSFLKDYFENQNEKNLPLLGICRGMQAIAVSQKMPLYVDIKSELGIKNRRYTVDKIKIIQDNSLTQKLIRKRSFRAVELHHQGINMTYFNQHKEKWPNIAITALSNGGHIAEAIEFSDRPVYGVQFHPEYTFGRVRRGTFAWLLKRACMNHNIKIKKNKDMQ